MELTVMFDELKNRIPGIYQTKNSREFSVMIPFIETGSGYDLLFEVRSEKIGHQPGDICFPGGRVETGEEPIQAAVRETCEELLISKNSVEILFPSDIMPLGDSGVIYPFAGILKDYKDTFSEDEVSEVFRVPLSFFMENEPDTYRVLQKDIMPEDYPYDKIHGGRNYKGIKRYRESPFFYWKDKTIWGITGRIILGLKEILSGVVQ